MARRVKSTQRTKRLTKGSRNITAFTRRGADAFGGQASTVNQKYLLAAGEVIAAQARTNAKAFSTRIPGATGVGVGDKPDEAVVITDGAAAPNALPFETGERHPLWGEWVTGKGRQPKRPYLTKAAKTAVDAALQVYAAQLTELVDLEIPNEQ